ncbi:MAG TPA: ligase-associated DNA damage response endonuclease PdeM [Gemmatimonadaceae bacterium]
MTRTTATVVVRGEELVLLPELAAFWPRERTLLVADPHVGKAAAFRAAGVPVPHGTTTAGLERIDRALETTEARRIIVLGDFLHAREGRAPETLRVVGEWRARHSGVEMVLVRGNHDRRAGDPPSVLNIQCVDAPLTEEPFVFTHHPMRSDDGYVLCGHVHPGVRLSGPARQSGRLPCFWFSPTTGVLPAFGDFTGLAIVEVSPEDRVWVVAGDEVIEKGRVRDG